jgi:hypothetical protein
MYLDCAQIDQDHVVQKISQKFLRRDDCRRSLRGSGLVSCVVPALIRQTALEFLEKCQQADARELQSDLSFV